MTRKTDSEPKGKVVRSSEETTVILNSIRYDIPRNEDVEVPEAVAEILETAGFLSGGKVS